MAMPSFNASSAKGSRGQVLIMAIILLTAGALVLSPLMGQLATMLQKGGNEREQRFKVYAAEAAINRVIADLVRGADGVPATYTTTEPHTGGTFPTFTITTSYTAPSITVNSYTPSISISLPSPGQAVPTTQQSYIDPGLQHPNLASVLPGEAFLMRLYNVKAGTLQLNWAYSPAGNTEVKIYAGMPVDKNTNLSFPAGRLTSDPTENPILDTGKTPSTATFNRTAPVAVDPATDTSGGVYSLIFFNKSNNTTLTTAPFAPSGGATDTWVYAQSQKDYIITASTGGISVTAYVRQVPGFSEPPASVSAGGNNLSYIWSASNVSFTANVVSVYTWLSP